MRPSSWDFPLFLHVFGAMTLFGAALTAFLAAVAAWRSTDSAALRRAVFLSLLVVGVPAYVAMRGGAQWIYSKEDLHPDMPTWIKVGILVGDGGALVLIGLTILGWLALARRPSFARYFGGLAGLYLVGLFLAWWAMSAKPGA